MAYRKPEPMEFEVTRTGTLGTTPNDSVYLECETELGTIAFWGDRRSMANIDTIRHQTPPFRVRCGCIPPGRSSPQHKLWVPQSVRVEILSSGPASTGVEPPVLYVVSCTERKIWDDAPDTEGYIPAQEAYTGTSVQRWLASETLVRATHWLFLSAKYGFIEPNHPIGRYDVTFDDDLSGPVTLECLIAQVEHQRRWGDRVPLNTFKHVRVWGSHTYMDKVTRAFRGAGASVEQVTDQ